MIILKDIRGGFQMTIELLTSHASVRKYKNEVLSKDDVQKLIHAGQHASTANFVQAYSAIHVTDPDMKEQLATLSKNPQQILSAGAVLVLCMDFHRIEKAAQMTNTEIDYTMAENLLLATTDVALFAQNIAIAAESQGYGICFIGGVRNQPKEISQLLQLPAGVSPMYAMSIAVPAEANEVKPRLPIEAIYHENHYNSEKYNQLIPQYDETMKEYYTNRGANQKDTTWSQTMSNFFSTPKRPHMRAFLQGQGFDFK